MWINFRPTEYGGIKLLVDIEVPLFIYMKTDKGIVILNMATASEPSGIYQNIVKNKLSHSIPPQNN